jgi:hypothetical protein
MEDTFLAVFRRYFAPKSTRFNPEKIAPRDATAKKNGPCPSPGRGH